MAEYALQLDDLRGSDARGERGKLCQRDPKPRHAGIDLEMHRHLLRQAKRRGGLFEGFDVFGRGNRRGERVPQHSLLLTAPEAGHDQDGKLHSRLANRTSLLGRGYPQPRRSGLFEGARAFNDAMSVGIALDDAAGSDIGTKMAGDDPIVFSQRGERDFSPVGTSMHREFLLCG